MEIYRAGSDPIAPPPEPEFTGDVLVGGYFRRDAPSALDGATVTYAPGARTPWKANPAGQTVIVTDGVGWAQSEGEAVVEVHPGDTLWFAPEQRHWEGGTPDSAMTCVTLQERRDGRSVDFVAPVTDEEYLGGPAR